MTAKTLKLVQLIVFTGLLLGLSTEAIANNMHGVMMVVKGEVTVTSSKDGKSTKAKMGHKVYPADKIVTGKDSRAKIVMTDKNIINISPDTEMSIDNYVNDSATGTKKVDLSVLKGKIRSTVMEKYDGEKNTYKVKTPTAVAGVRGTDFLTGHNPVTNQSNFVTFHGKVAVSFGRQGSQGAPPVMVAAGQSLSSGPSGLSQVMPVAPEELLSANQESNADGQIFDQDENRQPAQDAPPAPEAEKEPAPSNTEPPLVEEERSPSAEASPSMVRPVNTDPDKKNEINPVSSTPKPQVPVIAPPPRIPASATNEFAKEQIRSGRSKVQVRIEAP